MYVFNHDGFGALAELANTHMSEQDAADLLVRPLAESDITAIDWCVLTTGEHNCRTRHNRAFDGVGAGRELDAKIGRVIAHYNAQSLDLLDIVIKHGHDHGLHVYGNVRLNHALNAARLTACPGTVNFSSFHSVKKDFRSQEFHQYLAEIFEDLLAKGVDGISLDFERKAPFFPPGASDREKIDACTQFMHRVRRLTDKPVLVRVAYEREKGLEQGQDALAWMEEGLVDVVVPATHNHEPDPLNWDFEPFLNAAKSSPRPCQVWPQIWPTGKTWSEDAENRHSPEAVIRRTQAMIRNGADGVYYFNFCCFHHAGRLFRAEDERLFRNLKSLRREEDCTAKTTYTERSQPR